MQAAQAASLADAGGATGSMAGVNLSYGSQSSRSEQTSTQTQSQGSSLTAGNNLTVNATGTDINVQGSRLQAGKDISLGAARDVNLTSAQNTQRLDGKNESHGGSVGVGINVGQGVNGLSLNASVNKGRGSETGNGTTYSETTVNAGNSLHITSGRDVTLTGAQVSGEAVKMSVGRDLTLTSQQDEDDYDSKQQNASAGGSVGFSGGSASANLSQDKMHSSWRSVEEQTGIFAGKGGFDVAVGGHTQLNGAVIGSTADASKNKLDTGTLGFSDIRNQADYQVEHQSAGVSSGGGMSGVGNQMVGNMASGVLVGANGKGSDDSTTKSAVSDGSIIIRDKNAQKQDAADLSRDVEHANQTLSPIFDKEKEQNRLKEAQLIGEIGSQAADIARTQGDLNGLKAAKEQHPGLSAEELRKTDTYKAEMQKYGTGSALQQGIQAATAAVQGLAGGDIAKAIAGGSAPYIAEVIKQTAPDETSRVMAHAVVAGVLAQLQGNSAAAGAAGATTAALMGETIKKALYGDVPVSQLSEEQKQTLVALGTLAAGLAGSVTGGDTAGAVAGAQAGQNELSNNMAGTGMLSQMLAQQTINSAAMAEAGKGNANDQAALALTKAVKAGLSASCLANDACVLMEIVSAQSQRHPEGSGSNTVTIPVKDDLTDGRLVNPSHQGEKETSFTTPDQRDQNGATHTGNNDGAPDTGGNTTVTPIPDGPSKDDLVYQAEGRDNRLPISEPTVASNGLKVESNTKHTPGAQGFRPTAGIEPRNSLELFGSSISIDGNKARYTMGEDGSIHRYFPDNTGTYHWSGSTGDSKNPMQLDNKTKAQLRKQEGWKIK